MALLAAAWSQMMAAGPSTQCEHLLEELTMVMTSSDYTDVASRINHHALSAWLSLHKALREEVGFAELMQQETHVCFSVFFLKKRFEI